MSRARWTGWMLAATLAVMAMLLILRGGEEDAVAARIVTVEKGSIRSVAALEGRVAYPDETAAYALMPGFVEEIYVKAGERVAAGQALLRLNGDGLERVASAWAAQEQRQHMPDAADMQQLLENAVVRAPENGVVRQLLTAEHALVTAGMPVMVLSSSEQIVVCTAAEADAAKVQAGMRAELLLNGQQLSRAEVTEISDLAADALTGRVSCRIALRPEKPLSLPTGAAVEAEVLLGGREQVNVLPVEAVTERGTVWWIHEGRCTEIPAEIVLSDEINAWVRLPEGLQVAVGEFEEGQRVTEVSP